MLLLLLLRLLPLTSLLHVDPDMIIGTPLHGAGWPSAAACPNLAA